MVEQSQPSRQGLGTGGAILVGIGATLLVLLLIALFSFLVMGRCPMCDWMDRPMENGMMQDGMMDHGSLDSGTPVWRMAAHRASNYRD